MSEDKTTGWVILRQIFSLLVLFFTICLASLYLLGFQGTDWQVGVSEWAAVFSAEFYCATFYWDLGKEFLVEQVREVLGKAWWVRFGQERGWWTGKGSQPGDYMLLQDDEPFSDLP